MLSTYRRFQQLFFTSKEREALLFHLSSGAGALRFCYASSVIFFVLFGLDFHSVTLGIKTVFFFEDFSWLWTLLAVLAAIAAELIVGEFLPRWWVYHAPQKAHSAAAFAASLTLFFILFPFIFLLSRPLRRSSACYAGRHGEKDSQLQTFGATAEDKKLLASATAFRKRIAREIMVPRPDMFCLQASTTIREAAQRLVGEGYSRIPIYKENIDNIIGLLLYKEILSVYRQCEESGDKSALNMSVETLAEAHSLYT